MKNQNLRQRKRQQMATRSLIDSITCPDCGKTSYHPKDIEYRYCAFCNKYHTNNDSIHTLSFNLKECKILDKFNPITVVEDLCACAAAYFEPDILVSNESIPYIRSTTYILSAFHVIDKCISMMDNMSRHDVRMLARMCMQIRRVHDIAKTMNLVLIYSFINSELSDRIIKLDRCGEAAVRKAYKKKMKKAVKLFTSCVSINRSTRKSKWLEFIPYWTGIIIGVNSLAILSSKISIIPKSFNNSTALLIGMIVYFIHIGLSKLIPWIINKIRNRRERNYI